MLPSNFVPNLHVTITYNQHLNSSRTLWYDTNTTTTLNAPHMRPGKLSSSFVKTIFNIWSNFTNECSRISQMKCSVPGPNKRHFKLDYKGFRKFDIKTWSLSSLPNTDVATDTSTASTAPATQNSPLPLQTTDTPSSSHTFKLSN